VKPVYPLIAFMPLLLSLILALRAWRSHGRSFETMAWMAVTWILIIISMSFFAVWLSG
jgi:hypothetical protein